MFCFTISVAVSYEFTFFYLISHYKPFVLHCPSVGDKINPEGEVRGCDPERGRKMEQGACRKISKRKTTHKD